MKRVAVLFALFAAAPVALAAEVLVGAESFATRGGWVVDPPFMDRIGSPYLQAGADGERAPKGACPRGGPTHLR